MAFSPITDLVNWRLSSRIPRLQAMREQPVATQDQVFRELMAAAAQTDYGRTHGLTPTTTYAEFAASVPIVNYDKLYPWIERSMRGEANVLWPGVTQWFAKSSGTTAAKSKFIPVSRESLEDNHFKVGRDLLAFYAEQAPDSQLYDGLSLRLGGSSKINELNEHSYYGDLSAIMIDNLPLWASWRSTPSHEIALMDEWESKIEKIAQQVATQNVTSLFGVPSWMLVLLRRVLEIRGETTLEAVWPNLELFVHGGVAYTPYESAFAAILPPSTRRLETYNASEGFFAVQDRLDADGMLLMLEHGIFYEFIPVADFNGSDSQAIPLADVQLGVNYAVVLNTNGGLWRTIVGDTVEFTSVAPYRIRITGRTRLFINAFGEELMIDNAERAVAEACRKTGALVDEYTAAPWWAPAGEAGGGHDWLIEFQTPPYSLEAFAQALDNALKAANSDYEAKRYKNLVLRPPRIHAAPAGTFHNWLKSKGKLGGQNKVPRLMNDRSLIEELLVSGS